MVMNRRYRRTLLWTGIALLSASLLAASPLREGNRVAVGGAAAPSGDPVTVALILTNEDAVKAFQTDIHWDPEVATFEGATTAQRTADMTLSWASVAADTSRLVLYYAGDATLPAGSGAIAHLNFDLTGVAGTQTAVAPLSTILSDVDAQPLPVTAAPGSLRVIDPSTAPILDLHLLKNPGRPRTLQVFVSVDQSLTRPMTVSAGGTQLAMTTLDPAENLSMAATAVVQDSASVTVSAVATNGTATGETQKRIEF